VCPATESTKADKARSRTPTLPSATRRSRSPGLRDNERARRATERNDTVSAGGTLRRRRAQSHLRSCHGDREQTRTFVRSRACDIAAFVKLVRKAHGQVVEFDWAFGRDDGDGEGQGGEVAAEPDAAPILSDVTGWGRIIRALRRGPCLPPSSRAPEGGTTGTEAGHAGTEQRLRRPRLLALAVCP